MNKLRTIESDMEWQMRKMIGLQISVILGFVVDIAGGGADDGGHQYQAMTDHPFWPWHCNRRKGEKAWFRSAAAAAEDIAESYVEWERVGRPIEK